MNDLQDEEKDEKNDDFSREYEEKQKRYKPYVYFLLILIGLALLAPLIFSAIGYLYIIEPYLLVIIAGPFLLSILPIYLLLKCPACNSYMGKSVTTHCPKCEVRIRKDTSKNNSETKIDKTDK